ncbi:MAG TPA: 4'-phosphopantetheinyl transferase superfamily protein [Saprospiraceae bacterium]|nr:4'-phosphopantetheinyl transferase superfamily protein [Saprospiraceae bacterium]
MPQILHHDDATYHLGVWKIEEPESFFIDRLHEDQRQLPFLPDQRRLQSLAARLLLNRMMESPQVILKNESNKPFLRDDDRYISISHSFEVATVLVARRLCGVDIEKNLDRIERIAAKFLFPGEMDRLQGSQYRRHLYRIWGAKEAMFKAYGLGGIDFKKDLWIDLDEILNNNEVFSSRLLNHEREIRFEMRWLELLPDYILVYGSEI